jgi:peptidyl-tRNA hydrolase, PTH1 family
VKTVKIMKVICLFMQLDFAFHRGLEAVRIMVLEGFNKSATYINTSQASEMLNR